MKTFKHILVPTDFESSSAEAVDVATGLARALDARLTLLHVWEVPIYPYMEFMLNSEIIGRIEDRAVQRLDEAIAKIREQVPSANPLLKTGTPWAGIVDAIKEVQPDLVVMGTHGRRGFSHLMLGSVAEKVVRLSTAPVLTIRPKPVG